MRRFLTGMLVAALVIGTGTVSASAAKAPVYGRHYADLNQDGICDYCGEEDGCNLDICNRKGQCFVDKDGDGICDNYAEGGCEYKKQKAYKKRCHGLRKGNGGLRCGAKKK